MKIKIALRKVIFVVLWIVAISSSVYCQVPTDNPYTSRYRAADHWTDSLKWVRTINVLDTKGVIKENNTVDSLVFHNLMEKLYRDGGGVIFFPAGVYYFDFDISLYSDVVLRGEKPTIELAQDSDFRPPTSFVFPRYVPTFSGLGTSKATAFKKISHAATSSKNFGIVYIDINRAIIDFYVEDTYEYHQNILMLGIRQNNAAIPDPEFPSKVQIDEGKGWQRWPAWYKENIAMSTKDHGLVANCRLNDSITDNFLQPNYMTNDGHIFRKDTVAFNFAYHSGVAIFQNKGSRSSSEIIDNYIVSSRYFEKVFTNGPSITVANNVFVNTQPEKEHELIGRDNYSQQAIDANNKLFVTKEINFKDKKGKFVYKLLAPKSFDKTKEYPLVVFYHGQGEWGIDADHTLHFVPLFVDELNYEKYPCFVLIPLGLDDDKWLSRKKSETTLSMEYSLFLTKHFMNKEYINKDRVYVSGISVGASAAWHALLEYPKMFAAAVPIGAYRDFTGKETKKIKEMPVWMSVGASDPHIPIEYMRLMKHTLMQKNANLVYKEYADVGHFSWIPLYTDQTFLPWLFSQSKK